MKNLEFQPAWAWCQALFRGAWDRMRSSGHVINVIKHNKSHLNMTGNFFPWSMGAATQGGWGVPAGIPNPPGRDPVSPAPGDPARTEL